MDRVVAVAQTVPLSVLGLGPARHVGARARTVSGPVSSSCVINSHHCQAERRRSPTSRAPRQGLPFRLTSTREMLPAPDHATPRIAVSPRGRFSPSSGEDFVARTFIQLHLRALIVPVSHPTVPVFLPLIVCLAGLVGNDNLGQPLDGCYRIPTRHDQPQWIAMRW